VLGHSDGVEVRPNKLEKVGTTYKPAAFIAQAYLRARKEGMEEFVEKLVDNLWKNLWIICGKMGDRWK